MRAVRLFLASCVVLALSLAAPGSAGPRAARYVEEPAECVAHVGYDRDADLPGYLIATSAGPHTCVPFASVAVRPPRGYRGDFYVDAFSDARLRSLWTDCRSDTACRARVFRQVIARHPPNKEYGLSDPHARFLLGKLPVRANEADLNDVRRPAFFAQPPYRENIAGDDDATRIVEFTLPPDAYERLTLKSDAPVHLRGWYIRGNGIPDRRSGRRYALIVMTGGGGARIAAIDDPTDHLYRIAADGGTVLNDFPNATTGSPGQRLWRETAHRFVSAGFDVLVYDRRGVGLSDGIDDTNTLQQGRDILAIVRSLRTGTGLRVLGVDGATRSGKVAAAVLRDPGAGTPMPVLLLGSSRGTMSTGWAMTLNFGRDCSYDLPQIACHPAAGDRAIKGAVLLSEFTPGPGYVMAHPSPADEARGLGTDRALFIGGSEVENHIVFFPSSAILGGMSKWPAVFMARGLWDYAAALQGTIDSYRRVRGPKELLVVRGPHPHETWPASEQERVQQRMTAFAIAIATGSRVSGQGRRPWRTMRDLVSTASDVWEPSTKPTVLR